MTSNNPSPDSAESLSAIQQVDVLLKGLRPQPVPPDVMLRVRQNLSRALRPAVPEIMTLPQTAAFLQLSQDQLGELMDELPAFELAGQVRVRRARLLEWIEQRERDYSRHRTRSWSLRAG